MLRQHPSRKEILDEMHARPIVIVPTKTRVRRLVFFERPGEVRVYDVFVRLQNWCQHHGLSAPQNHMRQHSFTNDFFEVTWEFHNEFVTITWVTASRPNDPEPGEIGLEAVADLDLVCASRVDILDSEEVPEKLLPGFNLPSLCNVNVENGRAHIVSDFIEDSDGFVRFEFAAGALTPLRRSILTRRLLEIETYSKMALLGLPLVRSAGSELSGIEHEIGVVIRALPKTTSITSAQTAMETLNHLSLRVAALADRLSYRIAASNAYGSVIEERLASLGERPSGTGSSISNFVINRVRPAIRTMLATEKRLDSATLKITRAVSMLDARNGLELEIQNSEILATILQTSKSQFRLQKTVEGLSTIAISYYLLGIIGYAITAPLHAMNWSKEWALSLIAPIVLLGVFWLSRRFWRRPEN